MLRVSLPFRPCASSSPVTAIVAAILLACTVTGSVQAGDVTTVDAKSAKEAQKLRQDARTAAEKGDFVTAVKNIRTAARLTGDRVTAEKAQKLADSMNPAAGGSPFAMPQQLIQLIRSQTGNGDPQQWVDENGNQRIMAFTAGQGVFVGAPAILAALAVRDDNSRMLTAVELARTANHNVDVRSTSDLRMVSLPRLEQQVRDLIAQGTPIPEEISNLAGITRVQYLFVFPETGDVVIAGPAGDWANDARGQAVNTVTGRPTLKLDDLVTLTRTFSAAGEGFFMCTIDPKQDQVQQLQEFVRRNRRDLTANTAGQWAQELEQRLGLQNVFVQGVPADSRVASVIVEADYRMKEIGIGRRAGVAGMKSYFDLLTRSERRGSSLDALRWWMTVGYEAINTSPDGNVFELTGRSIKCLSEDQFVNEDGSRKATGKARRPNAEFARLFTEHLPALAKQDPVFADLENVFDMALVTSLLHSHGLARQVGWMPETFGTDGEFTTASVDVPTELMTAAASRVYEDRSVVLQVAGGVRADVGELTSDEAAFHRSDELTKRVSEATPVGQQDNRWWWDAAVDR
ncbi:MAG: DUF1598 domain-containing protein [Planctomycetaceae bacterium]